jgi:hypothetical protein
MANLYMRRFVWKRLGLERSLGSRIVTYADDLVILCRTGKAEEALRRLRDLMGKLKLTVNEEKTRICKVPEGEFTFLDAAGRPCEGRLASRRDRGGRRRHDAKRIDRRKRSALGHDSVVIRSTWTDGTRNATRAAPNRLWTGGRTEIA